MKNLTANHLLIIVLLFLVSFVLFGFSAKAQKSSDVIRQASCYNETLKLQADSLKGVLSQQGFVVVREATMTMESEYEMPVIVPLNEGSWYHIAFIGDMTSKLYEVRMYDYNEKQVVYQKHYGNGMESNIINYSYIPKFSEYHMIKPVQVNKKKKTNLCGYFIIFKKVK
ncbi:MAG TPA: hypothetical protein VMY77_04915 [Chitinophagaceae bacterium]|nr:hypothetical protein [Chitinophagaceae bacterium]